MQTPKMKECKVYGNDGAEVETFEVLESEIETVWKARKFMAEKAGIPEDQLGWRIFPSKFKLGHLNFIEISVNRPYRYNGVNFDNAVNVSVNALKAIYGEDSPVVRAAIKRGLNVYYAGNIEPHQFSMSPEEWEKTMEICK